MKCHVCGGDMRPGIANMPFCVSAASIVIIKELPIIQCENCDEHLLEDGVMERVEAILAKVDRNTELEIVRYAA